MAKTFQFPLSTDVDTVITKAKQHAKDIKANFEGGTHKGTFGGSGVKGEYVISGDNIEVTIHKKPLIAPWSMVENSLKDFFS